MKQHLRSNELSLLSCNCWLFRIMNCLQLQISSYKLQII